MKEIPMIIDEQIQAAINEPKKGKASDNNGIRAEEIKARDDATKELRKQIFNEVLKQGKRPSRNMEQNTDKILSTHLGNEEDVGNYRPICTLAALYTQFSTKSFLPTRLYHLAA